MTNPYGNNPESWRQEQCTPPQLVELAKSIAAKRWPEFTCWDTCARDIHSSIAGHDFWHPSQDALKHSWLSERGGHFKPNHYWWYWCNPPFRRVAKWVEHATRFAVGGTHVIMLLPAGDIQTQWVRDHHHAWDKYILTPRVNFEHPDTREVQSGAPSPCMFWISDRVFPERSEVFTAGYLNWKEAA